MAKKFSAAFYKSKAWRSTREYVLRRDAFSCNDCGGRGNEVHHIVELTQDNINDPNVALNPSNLMTLCGTCHKKRTLGSAAAADGYCFDANGQVVPVGTGAGALR